VPVAARSTRGIHSPDRLLRSSGSPAPGRRAPAWRRRWRREGGGGRIVASPVVGAAAGSCATSSC